MKTTYIADAFSNIDDAYINESLPAAVPAAKGKLPRAEGPIRRFLGSGWGAAAISAAVALVVLTGVIMAGRLGADMPGVGPLDGPIDNLPVGDGAGTNGTTADEPVEDDPTEADRIFAFDYDIIAPNGYGRGETITIRTFMTNVTSEPIFYEGSSTTLDARVRLTCVLPDGSDFTVEDERDYTDDFIEYWYQPGVAVTGAVDIRIPDDAPDGRYQLTLYSIYNKDWVYSFPPVFTIRDGKTETAPAATEPPIMEPSDTDVMELVPLRHAPVTAKINSLHYDFILHMWSGRLSRDLGNDMAATTAMDGEPLRGEDILEMAAAGDSITTVFLPTEDGQFPSATVGRVSIGELPATRLLKLEAFDSQGNSVFKVTPPDGASQISLVLEALPADTYYVSLSLEASGFYYTMMDESWQVVSGCFDLVFRLSPDEPQSSVDGIPPLEVTVMDSATQNQLPVTDRLFASAFDPADPHAAIVLTDEHKSILNRKLTSDGVLSELASLLTDTGAPLQFSLSRHDCEMVALTVYDRGFGAVYSPASGSLNHLGTGKIVTDALSSLDEGLYYLVFRIAFTEDGGETFTDAYDYPMVYLRRDAVSTTYPMSLVIRGERTTLSEAAMGLTDEGADWEAGEFGAPLPADFADRIAALSVPTVVLSDGDDIGCKQKQGMSLMYASVYDKENGRLVVCDDISSGSLYMLEELEAGSYYVILHTVLKTDRISAGDWLNAMPFDYEYLFILEKE